MKLFALGCLYSGAIAKDIKQHKLKEKMMENRLKFDRDVIMNPGNADDDEEWDPWDLEDEELQVCSQLLTNFWLYFDGTKSQNL